MDATQAAAAAIADALLLSDLEAQHLAGVLSPGDVALVEQLAGQPIAGDVFSRLVQLRYLQTAVEQMSRTAAKIETDADLYRMRLGLGEQIEEGRFRTGDELALKMKQKPRRLKVFRPPADDDAGTGPTDSAAEASERPADPREIGELPPIEDPQRRAAALADFRTFCKTYFPEKFTSHHGVPMREPADKINRALSGAGLFFDVAPRGRGATTNSVAAVIAAVLRGEPFIVVVSRTREAAQQLLESVKYELSANDRLAGDFPEVCYPIRRSARNSVGFRSQTYRGELTRVRWESDRVDLPTIPDALASGVTIHAWGINQHFAGAIHRRADGSAVRPSFLLVDDPVAPGAGFSPAMLANLERSILRMAAGLRGFRKQVPGMMFFTVDDAPADHQRNLAILEMVARLEAELSPCDPQ